MSAPSSKVPERLRAAGGTDFEQQLLGAAAREQPSPELSKRMALALGLSASAVTTSAGGTAATAGAQAPKAAAAASKAFVVWMSGGAVAAAVTVAIVASRLGTSAPAVHPTAAVVSAPAPLPSSMSAAEEVAPAATNEKSRGAAATASSMRNRGGAQAADLQDQIALVDAARSAVSAGAGGRALEVLSQYQTKYPAGSFRPEAAALKIEALVGLGRTAEARALAERFVAEHRGTPLADRVARVAGL